MPLAVLVAFLPQGARVFWFRVQVHNWGSQEDTSLSSIGVQLLSSSSTSSRSARCSFSIFPVTKTSLMYTAKEQFDQKVCRFWSYSFIHTLISFPDHKKVWPCETSHIHHLEIVAQEYPTLQCCHWVRSKKWPGLNLSEENSLFGLRTRKLVPTLYSVSCPEGDWSPGKSFVNWA